MKVHLSKRFDQYKIMWKPTISYDCDDWNDCLAVESINKTKKYIL